MSTVQQANVMGNKINNDSMPNIDRNSTVLEACKLMRKTGSAELIVTEEDEGGVAPVGILTANDIVTFVIAAELDPGVLTAGDIASPEMTSADTVVYDA
ncbi:MAG: CBS domain-containing protein [Proteobacteria bacterium]|nr:CBS domain-containing protein [Pseudomonadota bacterium]